MVQTLSCAVSQVSRAITILTAYA